MRDFGLARLMDHHKLNITTLAAGTLGYMASEMLLVLEVLCGRHPLDLHAMVLEDLVLLRTIWQAREANSLSVTDPKLLQTLQPSRSIPQDDHESMYEIKPCPLPSDSQFDSEQLVHLDSGRH